MPNDPGATVKASLADRSVPTYAALLDAKLILHSKASPYFAVDQHFFFDCFALVLADVYFDEAWYLASYPDIGDAVRTGKVASAWHHYIRFGFYEHRLPYKIEVDEAWYLRTYPDVKTGIERRLHESGQAHFEAVGYREGRLPHPGFKLRKVN